MLKIVFTTILASSIALQSMQDKNWHDFLVWSRDNVETSLHSLTDDHFGFDSAHLWTFEEIKKSLHPEWVLIKKNDAGNLEISHGVALHDYFNITYPWHAPFFESDANRDVCIHKIRPFSCKEIQELSDSPPVVLEPLEIKNSTTGSKYSKAEPKVLTGDKDFADAKNIYKTLLLFRHPNAISFANKLPKFNAKFLLKAALKKAIKK